MGGKSFSGCSRSERPRFDLSEKPEPVNLHDSHVERYKTVLMVRLMQDKKLQQLLAWKMGRYLTARSNCRLVIKEKWSFKNRLAWLILKVMGER